MFSSKSARGFVDGVINTSIPADAVEISAERHAELMAGQLAGMVIEWGDDGLPVLVAAQLPTDEELAIAERAWRDAQIVASDGVVARHRDEVESGSVTTLTSDQYIELQAFRRALRNWPEAGEFPLAEHRPAAPLWLTGQLQ
jgi:peptidyl-tRNA hydrolase